MTLGAPFEIDRGLVNCFGSKHFCSCQPWNYFILHMHQIKQENCLACWVQPPPRNYVVLSNIRCTFHVFNFFNHKLHFNLKAPYNQPCPMFLLNYYQKWLKKWFIRNYLTERVQFSAIMLITPFHNFQSKFLYFTLY